MDNGCPKCSRLIVNGIAMVLCLDCQLEQAEATALQDMNAVEEIKKKILLQRSHETIKDLTKENENELPADKR